MKRVAEWRVAVVVAEWSVTVRVVVNVEMRRRDDVIVRAISERVRPIPMGYINMRDVEMANIDMPYISVGATDVDMAYVTVGIRELTGVSLTCGGVVHGPDRLFPPD